MLPSIAKHSKMHNIIPSKKLGQNFLFDMSLCEKIVRSSGAFLEGDFKNQTILEIGPGPGGLTRAILSSEPKKLIAIEKDSRCIELLSEIRSEYKNLEVISKDAMKLSLSEITNSQDKISIIANLPYNIGTQLLFRWLDEIEMISSITIMLQKEVVERICAKPNSKSYGKLSVMTQMICDTEKMFDVPKEAFYPPPKVTSSIVNIKPKENLPKQKIIEKVRDITHLAFMQRRKMIKKAISSISDDIVDLLTKADIDPNARAENLTIEDYQKLALLCL